MIEVQRLPRSRKVIGWEAAGGVLEVFCILVWVVHNNAVDM